MEIIFHGLTEQAAFDKEKEFILLYKKFGYCEANLTDGGQGSSGWSPPSEWIEKCKLRNAGTRNPMYGQRSAMAGKCHTLESRMKISASTKGRRKRPRTELEKLAQSIRSRGNTYSKGRKLSDEQRRKIGASLKGKMSGSKNPMFGKVQSGATKAKTRSSNPHSRKIINTITNVIYDSIRHASEKTGISRNRIRRHLNGKLLKKSEALPLKYLSD